MHYSVSIKYNNLVLFLYFSPGHLSLVTGLLPVLSRPGPVPHVAGGVAVEPAGQDGGQAGVSSPGPGGLDRPLDQLEGCLLEQRPAAGGRVAVGHRATAEDGPEVPGQERPEVRESHQSRGGHGD